MANDQSEDMAQLQRDLRQIIGAAATWIVDAIELCELCHGARYQDKPEPCDNCKLGWVHNAALRGIADALTPVNDLRFTLPEPFLSQAMEVYHDRAQSGIEYPDQHGAGTHRHD